jgi:hypothetical protein
LHRLPLSFPSSCLFMAVQRDRFFFFGRPFDCINHEKTASKVDALPFAPEIDALEAAAYYSLFCASHSGVRTGAPVSEQVNG